MTAIGLWCITLGLGIGVPAWLIQSRRAHIRRTAQARLARNPYAGARARRDTSPYDQARDCLDDVLDHRKTS